MTTLRTLPLSALRPLFNHEDDIDGANDAVRELIAVYSEDSERVAAIAWIERVASCSVIRCAWSDEWLIAGTGEDTDDGEVTIEAWDDHGSTCECCGKRIHQDDARWDDGREETICEDCYRYHYFTCSECGETHHNSNAISVRNQGCVCEDCYGDHYFTCDDCGDVFHNDYHGGDGYCEDCYDNNRNNRGPILDYHTSPLDEIGGGFLTDEADHAEERPVPVFFGIELEMEYNGGSFDLGDAAQRFIDKVDPDREFLILTEDGSISNGWECVTVPATLRVHRKRWKAAFSTGMKLQPCNRSGSDTCGMHVHTGRDAFNGAAHIARFERFFNAPVNLAFIAAISGRNGGTLERWARPMEAKRPVHSIARAKGKGEAARHGLDDKYRAVNVRNPMTIEVRIFRSAIDDEARFFGSLDLVAALVEFTRVAGLSDDALRFTAFLEWMGHPDRARTYRAGVQYLARIGLPIIAPKGKGKGAPRLTLAKSAA